MELKGQPYFGVLTKRIPPLAVLFRGGLIPQKQVGWVLPRPCSSLYWGSSSRQNITIFIYKTHVLQREVSTQAIRISGLLATFLQAFCRSSFGPRFEKLAKQNHHSSVLPKTRNWQSPQIQHFASPQLLMKTAAQTPNTKPLSNLSRPPLTVLTYYQASLANLTI